MLTHLLKIVHRGAAGHLFLLGLRIGQVIHTVKGALQLLGLLFQQRPQQDRQFIRNGLCLSQHDFFQLSGCAGHQYQAPVISAFGIDTGRQHTAHAVTDDEDVLRVDAFILPQQFGGENGVLNGLGFHRQRTTFVPQQFERVRKGALVIADRGDAMGRQALGQIFEWGQFLDLLIHIAGARTVDKHHGGHRCGDVLRQGQQAVEGVMGAFTNNDGFLFHNRSSFLLLAEPPGIYNGNAHQDAQYYRQHPRKH